MNLSLINNYFTPTSILDIGANIGQFYHLMKQQWPDAETLSIEANVDCEPYLKALTDNYKICLLAKDNNAYEYYKRKSPAGDATGNSIYKELTSFFAEGRYQTEEIIGETLADVVGDRVYDLIKIDTQGSELDIISGGIEVVKKAKGVLLEVSVTQYNENAPLFDEVMTFMGNLDFTPVEVLDRTSHHGSQQQDIFFVNNTL